MRFGGAAGETVAVDGAGGVFSGGVALTARGRLAGASLASFSAGRGASLCLGDERGRLLRLLAKSIFGLRCLKVLNFTGAGLILSAA